jgi:hypothetical protein
MKLLLFVLRESYFLCHQINPFLSVRLNLLRSYSNARIFQRRPNGIYWIDYVAVVKDQRINRNPQQKLAEQCLQIAWETSTGKFKVENRKPGPLFADF